MYNKQGQNLQYGEPMGQAHGQAFQYASPMGMQNTAHAGRMPPSHAYKPSHGASSEGARPHGRVEALEIDQEQGGGGGMEMHIQQLVHDADKAIRHAFIRKVYVILVVQLLFTFGITALFTFHSGVKSFIQSNPGLFWLAWILSIGFLIALVCFPNVARKYPNNYVCLTLFTVFQSYLVGVVSSFYDTDAVFMALGLTIFIFVGLTIFAIQTKIDFTNKSGIMLSLILCLILTGILSAFIPALRVVYAGLGAFVFSVFIVYDTQLIVGGSHRTYQFSIDDYVLGALSLYIDFIQLFLFLLRIFGGNN